MSIVYRSVKGSKLTSAEVDGNFQHLENLVGGPGNNIVTETGFTLVDQDVTFAADWVWSILNTQYTNPAAVVINIPFAATGNQRIDLIVANQSNTFERIAGTESVSNPTAPAVPLNKISVTFITVTDGEVGTPTNPIIGTSFVKKSFFAPFISTVTGADAIIPLDPNGYTEIRLTDASLTSIAGFDLSLITGVPTAEVPYNGKPYIIRNLTGNDITIKNELGAADYPFFLSGGADLVFPNGQAIYVLYDASGFNEIFKSWCTLDEATDFGNTTTNNITTGIITTPMVKMPKGSFNVELYPVDLTGNRKLEAPNKNGIIATLDDIPFPTTGVPVTTNILSGNTDAAQAGAVSNVLYNFPIKKDGLIVRGANAPTNLEMQEFLLEMFIQGTYNPALKYSIYSIARNSSSNWFIRLYSQTGSPGTIVKIAEFSTTVSPENGDKITFHTLSEFGASGVSAKVAVNWSKLAVGSYYNMYDYNGYGLDLKVWDKQNSPLITLNEFPLPSSLVSKNLTTLETTNVKVNPLVYYNPRGNSEYIGNSTYSQTGLSAYMKVSSDTLVKMIDAPFFGTNFFGTVKIYTHPTLLTNPTLGTLVESFSLTSQDFNQNQLLLHRTILTNSIVVLANTYIYVVAENTSGSYPSIVRWTSDSVSSPLRDKILYKLSGTWYTGGSTFWSAPLALYSDIDSTQEILNLSTSKQDSFNPMLSIPSNVYAVVGTEMNLWYDALILSNDNGLSSPSSYRIDVICAKGTVTERCFRINALSGDVGSYPLTVNVYDVNKKIVDSKTITLNIKAYVSPLSVKNILRVGDSLTAANTISVTTQSKFSALGGNVPLFVGSKGTAPAKHEGIGGKRYLDFTIAGSPFFIGGVIDIAAYRAANSISSIDIAVFHLGVNDCMGLVVKTTHEINQIIGYAKQLFTAFLNDNSNTKIIIMLPTTDGNTKGGYGINYQATAAKEAYQKSIFLLRKAIIDNFDNGIYNANVSVGIAGLVCDRYYGYELGSQAVSQRVADLIPIHINAVHPAQSGYQQIGDNDFSHILSLI